MFENLLKVIHFLEGRQQEDAERVQAAIHKDFWIFPELKSPLKEKRYQTVNEIQEKYDGAAGGDSNKGFFRVFGTVEETLGKLCEVPSCLL